MPGKAGQIGAARVAILDPIAGGNGAASEAALRGHLSRSLAFSADLRARYPGYLCD